jgi:hypothetical protein
MRRDRHRNFKFKTALESQVMVLFFDPEFTQRALLANFGIGPLADMAVSFGGDAFTRFAQRPKRREQTGEARGPQRLIDFSSLTAKLLDRR